MTPIRDVLLRSPTAPPPPAQRAIEQAFSIFLRTMQVIEKKKEFDVPAPEMRRVAVVVLAEEVAAQLGADAFASILPSLVELVRHLDSVDPQIGTWQGIHRVSDRGEYVNASTLLARIESRAVSYAIVESYSATP